MKVNFNQIITDLDEKPIIDSVTSEMVILKKVCINALLGNVPNEEVKGTEKLSRFTLAKKINDAGDYEVEITVEEVAKIKELIAKFFTTLIVGKCYSMLEG